MMILSKNNWKKREGGGEGGGGKMPLKIGIWRALKIKG
jgi:hypothetical protein